jgi:site-specific recombinase XerD
MRRRCGRFRREVRFTVQSFLDHLRVRGVVGASSRIDDKSSEGIEACYEKYLCSERALTTSTVGTYLHHVRRFLSFRFGGEERNVEQIQARDISRFLLKTRSLTSPGVAKLMTCALRSFFRFLFQRGAIRTNLASSVCTVASWRLAKVPSYLEPDEVEHVLAACDRSRIAGLRDYAIILLIARLGLRASEIVNAELDDVDWLAGVLAVRGKGPRVDHLPLSKEVGEALVDYLRQRPPCSSRHLFIRATAPHRGLSHPSTVSTLVRRAVQRAGLDPPRKGAHLLRHSLATGMLRRGASMSEVREILRHRSLSTTEIYAKVDLDALRALALPWPMKEAER